MCVYIFFEETNSQEVSSTLYQDLKVNEVKKQKVE